MLYIETIFDGNTVNPRPLVSGLWDSSDPRDILIVDLWLPGNKSILDAETASKRYLRDVVMNDYEFSINDWKTHIISMDLPSWNYNAFCRGGSSLGLSAGDLRSIVKARLIEARRNGSGKWQSVLAKAHMAYSHIERRGISNGIRKVYPIYSTDTWSGRSKTTGYNLQGQNKDAVVLPVNDTHTWFLHFDWTAADARVASLMSGDPEMDEAFVNGEDPYAVVLRKKRSHGIIEDRETIKNEWLRVLYSMDVEAGILSYFPEMKKWMHGQIDHLKSNGWLQSILGRKFYVKDHAVGGETAERAVFNASLQGSVAHAIHATLSTLTAKYPDNIFTEIHDSIVMTCKTSEVDSLVEEVQGIMTRPFAGILESNPLFPVKVSVGKKWKQWVEIKR